MTRSSQGDRTWDEYLSANQFKTEDKKCAKTQCDTKDKNVCGTLEIVSSKSYFKRTSFKSRKLSRNASEKNNKYSKGHVSLNSGNFELDNHNTAKTKTDPGTHSRKSVETLTKVNQIKRSEIFEKTTHLFSPKLKETNEKRKPGKVSNHWQDDRKQRKFKKMFDQFVTNMSELKSIGSLDITTDDVEERESDDLKVIFQRQTKVRRNRWDSGKNKIDLLKYLNEMNESEKETVSYHSQMKRVKTRKNIKSRCSDCEIDRIDGQNSKSKAYDATKSYKEWDAPLKSQANRLSHPSCFGVGRDLKFVKSNVIDDSTYTLPSNEPGQGFVIFPYRTADDESTARTRKENYLYKMQETNINLESQDHELRNSAEKVIFTAALSQEPNDAIEPQASAKKLETRHAGIQCTSPLRERLNVETNGCVNNFPRQHPIYQAESKQKNDLTKTAFNYTKGYTISSSLAQEKVKEVLEKTTNRRIFKADEYSKRTSKQEASKKASSRSQILKPSIELSTSEKKTYEKNIESKGAHNKTQSQKRNPDWRHMKEQAAERSSSHGTQFTSQRREQQRRKSVPENNAYPNEFIDHDEDFDIKYALNSPKRESKVKPRLPSHEGRTREKVQRYLETNDDPKASRRSSFSSEDARNFSYPTKYESDARNVEKERHKNWLSSKGNETGGIFLKSDLSPSFRFPSVQLKEGLKTLDNPTPAVMVSRKTIDPKTKTNFEWKRLKSDLLEDESYVSPNVQEFGQRIVGEHSTKKELQAECFKEEPSTSEKGLHSNMQNRLSRLQPFKVTNETLNKSDSTYSLEQEYSLCTGSVSEPDLRQESWPKHDSQTEFSKDKSTFSKSMPAMPLSDGPKDGLPFNQFETDQEDDCKHLEIVYTPESLQSSMAPKLRDEVFLRCKCVCYADDVHDFKVDLNSNPSKTKCKQNLCESLPNSSRRQSLGPLERSQLDPPGISPLCLKTDQNSGEVTSDFLPHDQGRRLEEMHNNELSTYKRDSFTSSPLGTPLYFSEADSCSDYAAEICQTSTPIKFDQRSCMDMSPDHVIAKPVLVATKGNQFYCQNQSSDKEIDEILNHSKQKDVSFNLYERIPKSEPNKSFETKSESCSDDKSKAFHVDQRTNPEVKDFKVIGDDANINVKAPSYDYKRDSVRESQTLSLDENFSSEISFERKSEPTQKEASDESEVDQRTKLSNAESNEKISKLNFEMLSEENESLSPIQTTIKIENKNAPQNYCKLNEESKIQGIDSEVQDYILYLQNRLKDCEKMVQEQIATRCHQDGMDNVISNLESDEIESSRHSEEESDPGVYDYCCCNERRDAEEDVESIESHDSDIPPFRGCDCMKEDYYKIMQLAYNK